MRKKCWPNILTKIVLCFECYKKMLWKCFVNIHFGFLECGRIFYLNFFFRDNFFSTRPITLSHPYYSAYFCSKPKTVVVNKVKIKNMKYTKMFACKKCTFVFLHACWRCRPTFVPLCRHPAPLHRPRPIQSFRNWDTIKEKNIFEIV